MAINAEQMRLEEQKKNAVVAYVLWWFFGFFGAHRFYMRKDKALVMLIITILSILTAVVVIGYIGLLAMFVWWIIDGINLHKWVTLYNLQLIDSYEKSTLTQAVPAS